MKKIIIAIAMLGISLSSLEANIARHVSNKEFCNVNAQILIDRCYQEEKKHQVTLVCHRIFENIKKKGPNTCSILIGNYLINFEKSIYRIYFLKPQKFNFIGVDENGKRI